MLFSLPSGRIFTAKIKDVAQSTSERKPRRGSVSPGHPPRVTVEQMEELWKLYTEKEKWPTDGGDKESEEVEW